MSFGKNLQLTRKEKGITQEQLAKTLKVSRQAISKWESDNGYPETDKLVTLADALDVSIDYLLDHKPAVAVDKDEVTVFPAGENKIMISTYDSSQIVSCLSVRYSKIAFPSANEPAYILQAVDRIGFFGAHTIILGWYEDEKSVKKEVERILSAMESGQKFCALKYFTDVKLSLLGTASRRVYNVKPRARLAR